MDSSGVRRAQDSLAARTEEIRTLLRLFTSKLEDAAVQPRERAEDLILTVREIEFAFENTQIELTRLLQQVADLVGERSPEPSATDDGWGWTALTAPIGRP